MTTRKRKTVRMSPRAAAESIATVLADGDRLPMVEIMWKTTPRRLTESQFRAGWRYLKATVGSDLVAMEFKGRNGATYFRTDNPGDAEAYDLWLTKGLTTRTETLRAHVVTRVDFTAREGSVEEMLAASSDEGRIAPEVQRLADTVRVLGSRLGYSEVEIESWLPAAA